MELLSILLGQAAGRQGIPIDKTSCSPPGAVLGSGCQFPAGSSGYGSPQHLTFSNPPKCLDTLRRLP
eukprot:1160051-Pelagomonas_calceolata.AAC.4